MSSHNSQPTLSDILQLDPARVARLTSRADGKQRTTRELSSAPVALPDVEGLRRQDRAQLHQLREQLHQEGEIRRALERHLVELRHEVAELRLAGAQLNELSATLDVLRQENQKQEAQLRFARRLYQRYQKEHDARQRLEKELSELRPEVIRLRSQVHEAETVAEELAVERQTRQRAEHLLRVAENRSELLRARVNELVLQRSRSPLQRVRLWFGRLLGREMVENSLL